MSIRTLVLLALSLMVSGCAAENVRFNPNTKCKIAPTSGASILNGSIESSKALYDQSKLPHNTPRQRYDLERRAGMELRNQLGSQDYLVIGEVFGGGNAYSNIQRLEGALAQRAAKEGGDVVMIFRSGTEDRPFAYSTPGYSTTNVYGSTYAYGNYAHGNATANTTYYPGQTYSGTMHFPFANGLVFKYAPGVEALREATANLADDRLEPVLSELARMNADPKITFEAGLERWRELVGRPTSAPAAMR